jgi:hypothetical protein
MSENDRRLIEDYLPIEAITKEPSPRCVGALVFARCPRNPSPVSLVPPPTPETGYLIPRPLLRLTHD